MPDRTTALVSVLAMTILIFAAIAALAGRLPQAEALADARALAAGLPAAAGGR